MGRQFDGEGVMVTDDYQSDFDDEPHPPPADDGCSCEPKGQAFHERTCAQNDGYVGGET